jgi:hypothetical protein
MHARSERTPIPGAGKCAQVIDRKGDKVALWRKRVRKRQKTKGLNEIVVGGYSSEHGGVYHRR